MKRIVILKVDSVFYDRERQPDLWTADAIDYTHIIRTVLRTPLNAASGGGATPDEMRRSIRVLDRLEGLQPGDVLALEDADWEHLKAKVLNYPYAIDDRRILTFIDTVLNATEITD